MGCQGLTSFELDKTQRSTVFLRGEKKLKWQTYVMLTGRTETGPLRLRVWEAKRRPRHA